MRILARRIAVHPEAADVVLAIASRDVVWLDSGLPEGAPADVAAAASARARWSIVAACDGPSGDEFVHGGGSAADDVFGMLADRLAATPRLEEPIPGCGFALGWVGYLGYELGRESGGPDRSAPGHPDVHLWFVDRAVVVDHVERCCWVLALDDGSPGNARWAEDVAARIATGSLPVAHEADAAPGLPADAAGRVPRAAYEAAVAACREEIRHGNAFQVCLTTAFSAAPDGLEARGGPATGLLSDPEFRRYLALRAADPVPFGAFLRLGRVTIAGRSPERFLQISAAGEVLAEPIKGTRPRGTTPAADAALREELRTSTKDRAENVMIVDLLRNDLLRTAEPGSVRVDRLCAVETYATVHQLVSTLRARVPDGTSRAEVVRAAFPPGSMTGAPKISAMAIADRLEGAPRGVYSGVVGYFSASGAVDLAVTIRSLVTVRDDDGAVVSRTLGAGGAVTWGSVPADEADEVETKTRSVLGTLGSIARW